MGRGNGLEAQRGGGENTIHRIPPHSIESEQAVLGGIMLANEAINPVVQMLKPHDFYLEKHQWIYEVILELESQSDPMDALTVFDRLKSHGKHEKIGGLSYLAELADSTPTAANINYYARIVQKKSLLRRTIDAASQIVSEGYQEVDDIRAYLDQAESRIFEIRQERQQQTLLPVREIVSDAFRTIEKLYQRKELVTGVPSGFDDLDRMTSGMQPSDLLILAGRPSMGKTTLALNMATNAALYAHAPVAFFSLEMSREQLVMRMLCSQARVDSVRLRTGHIKDEDVPSLTRAASELAQAPFYIDDTPGITVMQMRAKCRRLKMELGSIGMICIDYLQLMQSDNARGYDSREREISEISRSLKALAKELDAPVLALSQLNRSLERRPDKRPIMSDLRESGALEQDADVIVFVYRDEVYNEETEDKGIAEVIIGKQRNGPIGTVRLKFFHEYTRFDNLYLNQS